MKDIKISEDIRYIGVDDKTLDLFESQYKVDNGVSYNSYLILDEKTAILDTVDKRAAKDWLTNLKNELNARAADYLIISHMEPDHAANIKVVAEQFPMLTLVGNTKTFQMLDQFFDIGLNNPRLTVKEGDILTLGKHTLQFFMAPMVHWPEVMVTYEQCEKILFSADGFGKFGTLDTEEEWTKEARRYYFNICGKYGIPVQALLKKAEALDIRMICPLHGPMLKEDIGFYIGKYNTWSNYDSEEDGILIAYASIHGHTKDAALKMKDLLEEKGCSNVVARDLSRSELSDVLSEAFCYPKLIIAATTYDGGLFPCMEDFLLHLKAKNYQKKQVGIIENGSWAPQAGKHMKEILSHMKEITICDKMVTIRSAMKENNIQDMKELAGQF